MNRRGTLVALLALGVAPRIVGAQPTGKLYRIGWLDYSSSAENLGIFDQAMAERGWIKGGRSPSNIAAVKETSSA